MSTHKPSQNPRPLGQVVAHAPLLPHPNMQYVPEAESAQVPLPSQKGAGFCMLPVQVGTPQDVDTGGNTQAFRVVPSHVPVHAPAPGQATLGVFAATHFPSFPALRHDSQMPSHD